MHQMCKGDGCQMKTIQARATDRFVRDKSTVKERVVNERGQHEQALESGLESFEDERGKTAEERWDGGGWPGNEGVTGRSGFGQAGATAELGRCKRRSRRLGEGMPCAPAVSNMETWDQQQPHQVTQGTTEVASTWAESPGWLNEEQTRK